MFTQCLLAIIGLPVLSSASPLANRASNDLVFTVRNYKAVIAPGSQSVSFEFIDPRANYSLATTCSIPAQNASIYRPLFTGCQDDADNAGFRINDGQVEIRRAWDYVYPDGTSMHIAGYAPQGTYWTQGVNMSTTEEGTVFTRTSDWAFPVTTVSASS